jgi:hypothetical protein
MADDEFKMRYAAAKAQRSDRLQEDGYEVYKFCFNGREEEWAGKRGSNAEPEEIFADFVADIAEEFYGDLFHTMTPANTPWVEFEAGTAIPEEMAEQVKDAISEREGKIAKAIRASNYYTEGQTAFQDAILGNVAMWVDRYSLSPVMTCEAVPCSELMLRLGPFGIDDRFREKKYYYRDLPALFPDAQFPREIARKIQQSKSAKGTVVWGFWRDYSDPESPQWKQCIRVDGKSINMDKMLGPDGSCPLLVGRFNAIPNSPWGRGPARRMLPRLRVMDEMVRMILENMDHTLDPSIVYPHDGMLDLSDGLEAGVAYPSMPGSGEQIREIGGGKLDVGYFLKAEQQEEIRQGFYREPEQRGKTPPSASQYLGEEQKSIRRMARPAGSLWEEFGVAFIKRTEWLQTQPGGVLEGEEPITADGQNVILDPISPLERAQAREEVLVAQSIMGIAFETLGPEQTGMLIDGPITVKNIKERMKDTIVRVRTQEEIMQIAQQMMQQQQPQGEPQ